MSEPQNEPLISCRTSVNMGPEGDDSTKRALTVAGFTVLACTLIAGQAFAAYFLLSQKSQISTLADNIDSLKKVYTQSGSSNDMALLSLMSAMSILTADTSEDLTPKEEPSVPKPCKQLAVEAGPTDFRPQCDTQGNFLPIQCQHSPRLCWCVNPLGQMIQGTARAGRAICGSLPTAMVRMAARPRMLELQD